MTILLQFVILGLSTGSLYVLGGLGLVLVKRSSGVINFAHSAIGMVATYCFWELRENRNYPFAPSFLISLVFAAVLSALIYIVIMRPLRNRSLLTQLVATLAVMATLQAAAALRYPEQSYTVHPILPSRSVTFDGISIGLDRIVVFVGVLVLVAVLGGVYRFTSFGRVTTAVADNGEAAAGLGISPDLVSMVNWTIGGGLAAVAGIFLAPILGLDINTATLLIVPMLAAAVAGDFNSFPLTLAGGLVIGVAQSLIVQYTSTPGLVNVVPVALAVVVLLAKGRSMPARGEGSLRMPSVGSGKIRWIPMLVFTVGLIVVLYQVPLNWVDAITLQASVAIVLLSLVVVVGYCGQLSLAQFSFAGLGGWISGGLATDHGWPLLLALLAAVVISIVLGVLIAVASARSRGLNLAIITLAVAGALDAMVFSNSKAQGGLSGIVTPKLSLFGWHFDYLLYPKRYGAVVVVVLMLLVVAIANMRRSRVGRRLVAVRANERAASSLGISVLGSKVFAFSTGAAIAAIGGFFFAYTQIYLTFGSGQYNVFTSVTALQESVVGGVGWASGAPVGSALQPGSVGTRVLGLFGDSFEKYIFLIGGLLLLVTILQGPDGIVPNTVAQFTGLRRLIRRKQREAPKLEAQERSGRVTPKDLCLDHVTVRYGGVTAVSDLSLVVRPGKVTGLIGPNGAGKTSVLDAITGFAGIATGTVHLDGQDLGKSSPHMRSRLGLGRSFQALELFDDMTVLENLLAASEKRDVKGYASGFVWPGRAALTNAGLAAVREFGLEADLLRRPTELAHGRQRMLAIARTVAAEPSILLLDEPAAGLDEVESRELTNLIRRLASEWGVGILLIEHNVPLVLSASDYIYTIEFGQLIAEGTPAEISTDSAVRRAYLGTDFDHAPGELAASAAAESV
jgi:sulfate-transporting ATPase